MSLKHLGDRPGGASAAERGSSLVPVVIVTSLVAALAGAAMTFTSSTVTEVESERQETQALYLAEAGISDGMAQLAVSHQTGDAVAASIGTEGAPRRTESGERWSMMTDNGDGTYTIVSTGIAGRADRSIEAVVQPVPPGPFEHAMFAANLSGDPAYGLTISGSGGQADEIIGNIYSGGDVLVEDDASVVGDLRAGGVITGAPGQSGVRMTVPTTLEIDYEVYNDFNVADLFAGAPRLWDNAGGTANQLPESNPAHIFRKNPSDRVADTSGTAKDDYFLEDPYESVTADYPQDGSQAFKVSLPEEANNTVYYIDGNVWLHNKRTMSLKLENEGSDPTRVTFVVKGNVYFSDNLFYTDPDLDGVAFVALADENVEDSGNIYFGDPTFGTMQYAEAVMFAENNFYDNNLDAAGSAKVKIRGNMTAANQVAIDRDYERADGTVAHTKLTLEFDPRQANGAISLPGIPVEQDHPVGYVVATWREVPTPRNAAPPAATIEVETDDRIISDEESVGTEPSEDEDKNWRKRWKKKFKKEWKQGKRKGKWQNKKKSDAFEQYLEDLGEIDD